MKQSLRFLLTILGSAILCVSAYAQVTTSSFSGKITDKSGAPVAGATVLATHTASGSQYYTVADAKGNYRILNVRPGGPYEIKVDILGYTSSKMSNVEVALADNFVANFTLSEESLQLDEVVFVAEGKNSNMRSDRAGAIVSVSSNQIAALPSTGKSMNDVMRLSPHATSTTNGISLGGGNYRSSYVTVDGASFNNSFGIGGNLPAGGTPISLDALEQMAISITPYDVRQSGFTGGAIQTTTKSGTNDYHLTIYDYFSSDQFKGDRYMGEKDLQKLTLQESLANTLGVSISGPIIKNKLFYFVNFEYQSDVVPGNSNLARENDSQSWGGSTQYNRPTKAKMDEIKQYLADTYNYDPGRYADYKASTPDWKILARIDWNINENHRLTARYSQTQSKYSSAPSNSVSGLTTVSGYSGTRNDSGRTSKNSLYFESNRYFQEQNYLSAALELNSRLLDGAATNIFRATYSKQHEPRSYVGNLFPTVDIFDGTSGFTPAETSDTYSSAAQTNAVYTSFGLDPFTYGNLRDVDNVVVTDEFTYNIGWNLLTAGLSYEFNSAKNGYMQGGAGYYSFASWDDFKAGTPNAFSIMYGNNDDQHQEYPTLKNHQLSVFLQDEMSFADRFKLTLGVRLEVPFYPNMSWNENKQFTEKLEGEGNLGFKTSDMPKAAVNVSPRLGFNWDILGNRKLVLRGGTGIFTGRLPMVWLVSAVGNSNVLQNNWGTTDPAKMPEFKTTPAEIIESIKAKNPGIELKGDLAAPTGATILDKSLKMPQTWKSSLALDAQLPGGIKASVEGIFNKDLQSVYVYNYGKKTVDGGVTLPGEPEARTKWAKADHGISNIYYLTNAPVNGYYYSVTASLSKDFNFGLSLSASYTHASGKSLNEGIGDQLSSAWNTNTYAKNGSNSAELGYGSYVTPNRVIANLSYRIDEGRGNATTLGLFYEGTHVGYVGTSYSYTRYSYILAPENTDSKKGPVDVITNCGGANELMFIPTDEQLESMPFADADNKAAFKEFLATDKYLSKHRGEYSVRGAGVMPWRNTINFKVSQEVGFRIGQRIHTLQLGLDINNVGNLLNAKWGNVKYLKSETVLTYSSNNNQYKFNAPKWNTLASAASTWSALLSVRYVF